MHLTKTASNSQEKFYSLIEEVILNETDDVNKELFSIEGKQLVNQLFKSNKFSEINLNSSLDLGFTPEMDLIKTSLEFVTILVSIFNIYIQFRNIKKDQAKVQLDKIKLEAELVEEFKKNKSSKDIAVRIVDKYHSDILKLINE